MAAHATPIISSTKPAALRSLLATERDPHRLQRELVRASLFSCPGKSPRKPR
jgi:hypothetical protein